MMGIPAGGIIPQQEGTLLVGGLRAGAAAPADAGLLRRPTMIIDGRKSY